MLVERIWPNNRLRNFHYLVACPETGEALAVDPLDCRCPEPITLYDQPRDQSQRGSAILSGDPGRAGSVGQSAAPQDLQTGKQSQIGSRGGIQAPTQMGSPTNCRVAQAYLPVRRELPRVTRNHLPQPVHSSSGRLEQGTAATPSAHARHAPFAPLHAEDGRSRPSH